ncbi:MAG: ion transporter [Actinobacteria bacterium]|nr:ion transporter [Actinomycetota bacterium]
MVAEVTVQREGRLARLVDSDPFNLLIAGVIIFNAVVLGLETFPAMVDSYGGTLVLLNNVCYGIFVVELILRFASYGRRPQDFFRNGWNVFDLIIIGGVWIPGVRENVTVLRLLRLARVARLLRFLPDARVLLSTVVRSLPPLGSIVVLTVLILFLYGMIGWAMFGEALPNSWGTITRAMLTLFILLTLENFPVYLEEALTVTPWATVFFVSYVLVAAFVIFNLLIGIIISSMESAREREALREAMDNTGPDADALARIREIREALETLETDIHRLQHRKVTPPETTQ